MPLTRYPTSKPFPFSDAVMANGFIFLSGQVSMTSEGEPVHGSVSAQTQRIMQSISDTLARAGTTMNDIVRVQVWLSDMVFFGDFNAAYSQWFPDGYPARSVTTSKLAFNLDVEIEIQAVASAELSRG